jgi:hypothetical protein
MSAWYTQAAATYPHVPFATAGTAVNAQDIVEIFLSLGHTMDGRDGGTPRVAWLTHTSGQSATVRLHFLVAWQDVREGNADVVNAGTTILDWDTTLSEWNVLTTTCASPTSPTDCTSGTQRWEVYKAFDLSDKLTMRAPSPDRPGYVRVAQSIALSGVTLPQRTITDGAGVGNDVTLQPVTHAVLHTLDASTPCFPSATPQAGCASSGTTTYAAGLLQSDTIACLNPVVNRACAVPMLNLAPKRVRLSLQIVPDRTYDSASDTWSGASTTSYHATATHDTSQAATVAASSPCHPHPNCGSETSAYTGPALPTWAIILIVVAVIVIVAVVAVVIVVLERRKVKPLKTSKPTVRPPRRASLGSVQSVRSMGSHQII